MVFGAAGAAVATGIGNNDLAGMLTQLWETQRSYKVEQVFEQKMAAINFKIQLQTLQREDIRDLVQLTVDRMGMYHVVGTLLLTFVVQWYTENRVLESSLPNWFVAIFFISNFAAVAYLVFSVWLAMHAAITSHSIGVRLLTSYARLSIPGRRELTNLRTPVIRWLQNFLDEGSRIIGQKFSLWNETGLEESADKREEQASSPTRPTRSGSVLSSVRGLTSRSAFSKSAGDQCLPRVPGDSDKESVSTPGSAPSPLTPTSRPGRRSTAKSVAFDLHGLDTVGSGDDTGTPKQRRSSLSRRSSMSSLPWENALAHSPAPLQATDGDWPHKARRNLVGPRIVAGQSVRSLQGPQGFDVDPVTHNNSAASAASSIARAMFAENAEVNPLEIEPNEKEENTHHFTEGARRRFDSPPDLPHIFPVYGKEDEPRHHFRQFMHEQQKWLSYDVHARLCMAFGMNQLLQALGYYVLGVVWDHSKAASLVSFLAVKALAILLLILDIEAQWSWWEKTKVFSLHVLPSLMSAVLLHFCKETFDMLGLLAVPCYLLHAGWLIYLDTVVRKGAMCVARGLTLDAKTKHLRVARYLNVLHFDQVMTTEQVQEIEDTEQVDAVRNACATLQRMMRAVMAEELDLQTICASRRSSPEFVSSYETLDNLLDAAARSASIQKHEELKADLHLAERVLDYAAVWQKAPEIYAMLSSLRSHKVQSFLGEEQKRQVTESYHSFLNKCKELNIGIAMPGNLCEQPTDSAELEDDLPDAIGLHPTDWCSVRFDAALDVGLPETVWMDSDPQGSDKFMYREPELATSFCTAMGKEFPAWVDAVSEHIRKQSLEVNEMRNFRPNVAMPTAHYREDDPIHATANLPGRLVSMLTKFIAICWVLGAILSSSRILVNVGNTGENDVSYPRLPDAKHIATAWPESAGFLQVSSLSCNNSVILAGSEFAIFSSHRSVGGQHNFTELRDWPLIEESATSINGLQSRVQSTIDANMFASLSDLGEASWSLTSLRSDCFEHAVPVLVPLSWRTVALWNPNCAHASREAKVAGWDGSGIVIATLTNRRGRKSILRLRFRIQPGRGKCVADVELCKAFEEEGSYTHVRSLQLINEGRTLLVMTGAGMLDAWDLPSSTFLGRWSLGAKYKAMCCRTKHLLLAQSSPVGPVIHEIPLPTAIVLSGSVDTIDSELYTV